MILFDCPICGEHMEAPEDLRGENLECPVCGELVGVHGVNVQLTPDIRIKHTEQPIYAPQHWLAASMILFAIVAFLVVSVKNSNWEKNHSDQIFSLYQQAMDSFDQDDTAEGIRYYTQLEDLVTGEVITTQSTLDLISQVRDRFNAAEREILARKRGILEYETGEGQPDSQSMVDPNLQLITRAVKEYKEIVVKPEYPAADEIVVGKWMDPTGYNRSVIIITSMNDKYFFKRYTDNQLMVEHEIVEKESILPGICFDDTSDSQWQVMYRINSDGDLELWDASGYISTARSTMGHGLQ